MELQFDRFYRYADLTNHLKGFAARRPELFALESVGKSHEGRDIWMVTVTNTGPARPRTSPRSGSTATSTRASSRRPPRASTS